MTYDPKKVKIGFTGTQRGMTPKQKQFMSLILDLYEPIEVHHGDCIGADAQFHARCSGFYPVVMHPPENESKRAHCTLDSREGDSLLDPLPYLERNKKIVDAVDVMIAAPAEMIDQLRSGTWATVRYARATLTRTWLILPDGACHAFLGG